MDYVPCCVNICMMMDITRCTIEELLILWLTEFSGVPVVHLGRITDTLRNCSEWSYSQRIRHEEVEQALFRVAEVKPRRTGPYRNRTYLIRKKNAYYVWSNHRSFILDLLSDMEID